MKIPELLAPAGSMDILIEAVNHGASAVYFGLDQYNARMNATNFTMDDLKNAVDYAHDRSASVYVTLNTLVDDEELIDAVTLALDAYMLGVDAFLIQDVGLLSYLATHYPQIPVHASTQMNVFSKDDVNRMKKYNVKRVVLPRELSLEEIKERTKLFHEAGIETEVFIHGAMCVCYSGLCLFSSMNKSGSRSGNRGVCAQPCRQSYRLCEGKREDGTDGEVLREGKLLSPKDQSALHYLRQLAEAGVDSLKIEGRMRDAGYVSAVVSAYSEVLRMTGKKVSDEVLSRIEDDLLIAFNRGGAFTTQYIQGEKKPDFLSGEYVGKYGSYLGEIASVAPKLGNINIRQWKKDHPERGDYLSIRKNDVEIASFPIGQIEKKGFIITVKGLHPDAIAKLTQGMAVYRMSKSSNFPKSEWRRTPCSISIRCDETTYSVTATVEKGRFVGVNATATASIDPSFEGHPVELTRIEEQMKKTLDTGFLFTHFHSEDNRAIPARISEINNLRRSLVEKMSQAIQACVMDSRNEDFSDRPIRKDNNPHSISQTHITIADYIHLPAMEESLACGADIYSFAALEVLQKNMLEKVLILADEESEAKFLIRYPGAYNDKTAALLAKADMLMLESFGARYLGIASSQSTARTKEILPCANVFNHYTYEALLDEKPMIISTSYELSESNVSAIASKITAKSKETYMGLHRYGPIEWMSSEFCPLGQHKANCKMCTEHKFVSLKAKANENTDDFQGKSVDVVCYQAACRADLFGDAKNTISNQTVMDILNMGVPVASVVRFYSEDQEERKNIMASILPVKETDDDEYSDYMD